VQPDGQVLGISQEIAVRRKDRELMALGDRADQKVGVGALDTVRTTLIEKFSGAVVFVDRDRQHWEPTEV